MNSNPPPQINPKTARIGAGQWIRTLAVRADHEDDIHRLGVDTIAQIAQAWALASIAQELAAFRDDLAEHSQDLRNTIAELRGA